MDIESVVVSDNPRIDALRRRIEKDPSSIAFAQLAEEYRRSGDCNEAVRVCREGLATHPGYLSAQVTLGRALMELEDYDAARKELEAVLQVAPDNLAAIRALADIHQRQGDVEPTASYPPLELDIAPLEQAAPVDLSLDATMPTFEEIAEAPTPPPSMPADPFSFELPPALAAATEPDLPSLDALDSLTLDVPPLPDFSNWTLDTDLALDLPEPTFTAPSLERLAAPESSKFQDPSSKLEDPSAKIQDEAPNALELGTWNLDLGTSKALDELESWLAAVVADRSRPR
jgi:hypothetical protein